MRAWHDGASGTARIEQSEHNAVEILETEFPCRILRFDLVRTPADRTLAWVESQREYSCSKMQRSSALR